MEVIAIFDIGKTNKKCFLFDRDFNEVFQEYTTFEELQDDDGFPCDDLEGIVSWIKETLAKIRLSDQYDLKAVNFSTYGASLVHLDGSNQPLTPLYNYLKPYPEETRKKFFDTHGSELDIAVDTASPVFGMLNSGLQLYWLKQEKPEVFEQIHLSLHFPQYLSFLFTGEAYVDYTSLGCHTMLWNFPKNNYHHWVYKEGLDRLFAPLVPPTQYVEKDYEGLRLQFGIGIHDSSAALLPYVKHSKTPFLLLSTGTWSVVLNPFSDMAMSSDDLERDCLNFLRADGKPVRASRLFLGGHLSKVLDKLNDFFKGSGHEYKSLKWKEDFHSKRKEEHKLLFDHSLIEPERFGFVNNAAPDFSIFENYDDALFHLFDELTDIQVESIKLAVGDSKIEKIYVDGGFSESEVFVQFLVNKLPGYEICTLSKPLGSALGAAIALEEKNLFNVFMLENFLSTQSQSM